MVVMIISLVIFAIAVIVLLVAIDVACPCLLASDWFEGELERVDAATGGEAAAIIAICVLVALAMITLMLVELVSFRRLVSLRRPVFFLISSTEEGIAAVDKESICQLAETTVTTFHNIRDVKCKVREKANVLAISCRIRVALGTNIPELSTELQTKIKDSVERLTGLEVGQVDVKSRYESAKSKRLAVS